MKRLTFPHLSPQLQRGLVLGAIVLLGAALRFRYLDWAHGYYFQPDESVHTIDYLLRLPPSLNPYEVGPYTYGSLPLYLYCFTARVLSVVTGNPTWADKWHITMIARAYAATASTMVILINYALGRCLGSHRAGFVAALGWSLSPLSIQYAHYGVVDSLLTFFVVASSFMAVQAWSRDQSGWWMLAGIIMGLAIATKTTGLIWAFSLAIAGGGYWLKRNWRKGFMQCHWALQVCLLGF